MKNELIQAQNKMIEIHQDTEGNSRVQKTENEAIDETLIKILLCLIEYEDLNVDGAILDHFRTQLQMPGAKIRYYLDKLEDQEYLYISYRPDDEPMYNLNREGRAYLVENGII